MAGWISRQVKRKFKYARRSRTITIFVEESYLRDDIPCGSALCVSCHQQLPPLLADASHYVVPDADAILQFLEVLELPQFKAVIYLGSVVKEVLAQCSQRTYRRLRSLFTDRRRQCFVFDDEHFVFTCTAILSNKKGKEGFAAWYFEHIGRQIPVVVWRGQKKDPPSFSDDEDEDGDLLEQFKQILSFDTDTEEGHGVEEDPSIEVFSTKGYIQRFWEHDVVVNDLANSLLQSQADLAASILSTEGQGSEESAPRIVGKSPFLYKEHLSAYAIEGGIADGSLRIGVFHVGKHDSDEGFMRPSNKGEASQLEILIAGSSLQNRALPGDLVAVRLLPRADWRTPKRRLHKWKLDPGAHESPKFSTDEDEDLADDGSLDVVEEMDTDEASPRERTVPTGEVVGILQRIQRDFVACLAEDSENEISQSSSDRLRHLVCIPRDRRVPMVRLTTRQGQRLMGQRFVIRITGWERNSKFPSGHFVRVLGPIGDLETETMSILVENEINVSKFTDLALEELPEDTEENPWTIPVREFAVRRDIRSVHLTCSIDPPGSKDVDDALSLCQLSNGMLEIGVHIADVSYFLKQDSLLDLEARARGTTVYTVGRNWPMLPPTLSENLCSLQGGKDRLAVSVIWTVNPERDFEIMDVWFGRTIINSRHQMFYAQAQAILDGQKLPPDWEIGGGPNEVARVQAHLAVLAKFAQIRRLLRKEDGALELSSTELKFDMHDGKEPMKVDSKLELPMNYIVAELMILANSYVACRIVKSFPQSSLLRRHAPPRLDSFKLLLECCAARGFLLDTSSNKALSTSLEIMRQSSDPTVERAFKALVTRAMAEAEYCSTGEISEASGFYHYGLALKFYTHFTSPIRRYADVVVHRLLLEACQVSHHGEESADTTITAPYDARLDLNEVAEHLNKCHRASKSAQKECNELYLLMYLQKNATAEHAVVLSLQARGLVVSIPKYDLRGPVFLQNKNGDVLLPAEGDGDDKLLPPLSLRRQEGSLQIADPSTSTTMYEFKVMDPIWVQLKADGSRAHNLTLRIRLLSPDNPAAMAAQSNLLQENAVYRRQISKDKVEKNGGPVLRHHHNKAKEVEKRIMTYELEDVVAAKMEDVQPGVDHKKPNKKRKGYTVCEVFADFKRLKSQAGSIYLDFSGAAELLSQQALAVLSHSEAPHQKRKVGPHRQRRNVGLPQLVTFTEPEALPSSKHTAASCSLPRLWQWQLAQAARLRARLLRHKRPHLDYQQNGLASKEAESRRKARLVYSLIQM